MDHLHFSAGVIGFAAGFWLRGASETKAEPAACHCKCQWSGPVGDSGQSGQSVTFWGIFLTLVVVSVLVLSNVALVCRVTLRDSSTGTDREIQINVKGKSKGIHGAQRGLSMTG